MKRNATGLTALPEYPEMDDFPLIIGKPTFFSKSMLIIDLMVLMAEIPSAPPCNEAIAGSHISVIFGVILAMNGNLVARRTAAQYLRHSSGLLPTSDPIACEV